MKRFAILMFLSLTMILIGCGGDDGPTTPAPGTDIGPDGGTVTADAGAVTLVFPAGALDDVIAVEVGAATSPPANGGVMPGRAYDFEPDGTQFQQPVTLTIRYDDDQIPVGIAEDDLRLCKAVGSGWQIVPGSAVDAATNTVSASLTSFSTYAPGSPEAGGEASVTITPAEITLPAFGTKTFDALVEGFENGAVTWSIVEGIIGGRVRGYGVYTAPAGGGVFHLRATSVENPGVYGEAEVTVATDWECPEEPPESGYELVWAVEVPDTFQDWIYGIDWHEGALWVAGMGGIMHWTDGGQFLGWSGLGAKPDPDGPGIVHTYIGYHAGVDENDSPHPWNFEGAFSWGLEGLACDASGNVYVCDNDYHRVQKMSPGGLLMGVWELDNPSTVAVSLGHDVYVVDTVPGDSDILMRYTQAGVLVDTFSGFNESIDDVMLQGIHIAGFDDQGDLYLSSSYNHQSYNNVVARFDDEHEYLGPAVRRGSGMCESQVVLTVDADGNMYTVSPHAPWLFKKFDRDGWLLAAWPMSGPGYEDPRAIGGMTVDTYGNVYATDWMNGMILKFRAPDQ